jgi:4-amino-4-deoxy-L-arabinose transferase-like glycosyltransferase
VNAEARENSPVNPFPALERRGVALGAAVALFVLAVVVHSAVWIEYRDDPFFLTYLSDALSYDQWAQRLAERGLSAEPVFHQPPLSPLMIAQIYRLSGPLHAGDRVILTQILLNALATCLLVPIGRLYLRSTTSGVAAGLLVLGYAPFVFYGMKLLPIPLAVATQALALTMLGLARCRSGPWLAVLAGAASGLAALARTEMLVFVPLAIAALWSCPSTPLRPSRAKRTTATLAFLVGLALLVAPATLHNYRRGDAVFVSAAAGENLFIGNQRGADGGHTPLHPQAGDLFSQRALAERIAEENLGRGLRPSEIPSYWRGRAVEEVLADPLAWLGLETRKLWRVLHPGDPTDMYSLPLERALYLPALYALLLSSWGLWLLGGLGMGIAGRTRRSSAWPLFSLLAVHGVVLMSFFVSTRLKIPLLFFLAPFAGLALVEGAHRLRSGRRVWLPLVVLVFLALTTAHWTFGMHATPREALRLASVLSIQERLDESLEVLRPWIAEPDPEPLALDQAGWVRSKQGELPAARAHYLRALELGLPGEREAQSRSRLATIHERLGETEQAAYQHDAAVEASPSSAGARHERGLFRLRRGETAAAVADLQEAARLAPGWDEPRAVLRSLGAQPGAEINRVSPP